MKEMFLKSDIRKITIALEKAHYSDVYLALGEAGIIHLARFSEKDLAADAGFQEEEALTREILSGTEYALNTLMIIPKEFETSMPAIDKKQDATLVLQTKKIIERAMRQKAKIREKEKLIARQMEYAEALGKMAFNPTVLKKARLVKIIFGTVENPVGNIPSDSRFILLPRQINI